MVMKHHIITAISVLCAIQLSCQPVCGQQGSVESLVKPINRFGARLFQAFEDTSKLNLVFSPVSIHSALSMVSMGSSNGARPSLFSKLDVDQLNILSTHQAYRQMMTNFGRINSKPKPEYWDSRSTKLDFWTMLIGAGGSPINELYARNVDQYYNSSIRLVRPRNFVEVSTITNELNGWAKRVGFEKDIVKLEDFSQATEDSLKLVTAVHVNSSWVEEFDLNEDATETFFNYGLESNLVDGPLLVGNKIMVKYVEFAAPKEVLLQRPDGTQKSASNPDFDRLAALNFRAVVLSLNDGIEFTIIEPMNSGHGTELAELERRLMEPNSNLVAKTFEYLDKHAKQIKVDFAMPAFKFDSDLKLDSSLKKMGLASLFDSQLPQLTGIIAQRQLVLVAASHQATIEVSKDGVTAAGITFMDMMAGASPYMTTPPPIPSVVIRNPFMFVMRHDALPLFMGHLVRL